MTTAAIVMMTVICSLVWGGFLIFLGIVWRIEKRKGRKDDYGDLDSRS